MIVKMIPACTTIFFVTWSTVVLIADAQVELIGPSGTVYASPGDSPRLNCTVYNLDQQTDIIQWFKVGVPGALANIFTDGTYTVADTGNYDIDNSIPDEYKLIVKDVNLNDDDGEYDCYFSLTPNPDDNTGKLTVLTQLEETDIIDHDTNAVVEVDSTTVVRFTCEATAGNPAAEIRWIIGDDKDITEFSENTTVPNTGNDKLYDTTSILDYMFNSSDHGQMLKCRAFQHEDLIVQSDQIELDVLFHPIVHGMDVLSWENNVAEVECIASANPEATYQWESDDGQTGNTKIWKVEDVDKNDMITVTCTASNSFKGNSGEDELTQNISKPYTPTVYTTSESTKTAIQAPSTETSSGCDTGCIVGICVGCAVVVLLVIILGLWYYRRNKSDKEDDYRGTTNSHKPPRDTPSDVEMSRTATAGMTTVPPPSDDIDGSSRGYEDRYEDDRYANAPRHRYDDPPEDYSPRYGEPPIDEGDGYPNYSSQGSPNYSSYDRGQQSPQLHYADLDLSPSSNRDYQPPPREHTEYTTITPTIV